jgi:chaperonin cofactor prefoldin
MVTNRELEDLVTQVNAVLDLMDKRLQSLEKQHEILLHEVKNFVQAKPKAKKNG